MKIVRRPDGIYVDAETGEDLSRFIKAYDTFSRQSRGGSSKSTAKVNAARANGRKGGRPRKLDAPQQKP
jgi:hypothetical protein